MLWLLMMFATAPLWPLGFVALWDAWEEGNYSHRIGLTRLLRHTQLTPR